MNKAVNLNKTTYPYPRQRVFGLFLIVVGIAIALSSLLGTNQGPNGFIFVIGYVASMVGIMYNKKIRNKFAIGESTSLQDKVSNLSVVLLIALCTIIGMSLGHSGNFRLIWLLLFLAVGIHFIPFSVVHGKLMILLGILIIANACTGIYFSNVSFIIFGIVDSLIKVLLGIVFFLISPRK